MQPGSPDGKTGVFYPYGFSSTISQTFFLLFPDGVREIHTLEVPTYLALFITYYVLCMKDQLHLSTLQWKEVQSSR